MSTLTDNVQPTPTTVLLDGPALPPPDGITPHVTNKSEEQVWGIIISCLCTIIPGLLLILRLYTRVRILRKIEVTDYAVVSAFVGRRNEGAIDFISLLTLLQLLFLAMNGIGSRVVSEGAAVHMWNLQLKQYIKMQHWLYINMIVYGPTIFLVKLAILLQYLRMFAPTRSVNPSMWIAARVVIATTFVYYIISTLGTAFACTPRERIWNPLVTEGHCINNNSLILATCVFNIASDVVILLLPSWMVWKLQIPRKKKIGIVLLFALGLLACIANILIIYYTILMSGTNADISYNAAWFGCWVYAEVALGIIVTCMLSLPKLVEARGEKVRKMVSSITKPLHSFSSLRSLVQSTKTDSSTWGATTTDRGTDTQIHRETEIALAYQPYRQDVEAHGFPYPYDTGSIDSISKK